MIVLPMEAAMTSQVPAYLLFPNPSRFTNKFRNGVRTKAARDVCDVFVFGEDGVPQLRQK